MEHLNKEYIILFQGISEALETLETLSVRLKRLQAAAEEAYLERLDGDDKTRGNFPPRTATESPHDP